MPKLARSEVYFFFFFFFAFMCLFVFVFVSLLFFLYRFLRVSLDCRLKNSFVALNFWLLFLSVSLFCFSCLFGIV